MNLLLNKNLELSFSHSQVCSPTLSVNSSSSAASGSSGSGVPASGSKTLQPSSNNSHNGVALAPNGHPLAPKLSSATHKLLAKVAEITKMEQ